jgi:ABC-type Fe3+ transport system substrate-binding protein
MIPGFGSVALMNRAPHPNAAKVYLHWLLSPDGQRSWTENTKRNSRRLDVPPGDTARLARGKEKYVNTQKESMTAQREKVMQIAREILH